MADRRNAYKYAWEGDTAYDGPIEPGMWVLWATHSGMGYLAGRVLKAWPANIRLEPTAASDWRHECRRAAVRAAFRDEAEAVEVVTALKKRSIPLAYGAAF